MTIISFHPPLMGPGTSDVDPRILDEMSRPTIGHLDPMFAAMMDEMKSLLQYAFQTKTPLTLPVTAPGSSGTGALSDVRHWLDRQASMKWKACRVHFGKLSGNGSMSGTLVRL